MFICSHSYDYFAGCTNYPMPIAIINLLGYCSTVGSSWIGLLCHLIITTSYFIVNRHILVVVGYSTNSISHCMYLE